MSATDDVKLRLFRFDPSRDEAPYYEVHSVPRRPHMRVLDVLNQVYEEGDDSLAHRWYCGTKKCGECAVTVNGQPLLSCWEPAADEMTCEPLANFPVIRDLVVDTAPYEQVIMGLEPFMTRSTRPDFPEKVSHAAMKPAHHLSKCIECNVCTAAVPVRGLGPEGIDWAGYAGPAALVRFARFVLDPRDETDRTEIAARAGLADFPLYPVLAGLCPQGIDILEDALLPARRKLLGLDGGSEETPEPTTAPFVMAPGWSGFVRLTERGKEALCETGTLEPTTIPGIAEAFRLVEA